MRGRRARRRWKAQWLLEGPDATRQARGGWSAEEAARCTEGADRAPAPAAPRRAHACLCAQVTISRTADTLAGAERRAGYRAANENRFSFRTAATRGNDMADKLEGKRILITGPTGQVALPVTRALAADNDVIGIARFRDEAVRAELEGRGVTCLTVDLAAGEFDDVPDDVDYVINLAVVKSNRWEVDIRGNAEAAGLLMAHCRSATAFLHCSSTGVYGHAGAHQLVETD